MTRIAMQCREDYSLNDLMAHLALVQFRGATALSREALRPSAHLKWVLLYHFGYFFLKRKNLFGWGEGLSASLDPLKEPLLP